MNQVRLNHDLDSHPSNCQCRHHAGKAKRLPPSLPLKGSPVKAANCKGALASSSSDKSRHAEKTDKWNVQRESSSESVHRSRSSSRQLNGRGQSVSSSSSSRCSSNGSRTTSKSGSSSRTSSSSSRSSSRSGCSTCQSRSSSSSSSTNSGSSSSSRSGSSSSDSSSSSSESVATTTKSVSTNRSRKKSKTTRPVKVRKLTNVATASPSSPSPGCRLSCSRNDIQSAQQSDDRTSVTPNQCPENTFTDVCRTPGDSRNLISCHTLTTMSQPSSVSCESSCYSPAFSLNSPQNPVASSGSRSTRDPALERQRLRSYRIPHLQNRSDKAPSSVTSPSPAPQPPLASSADGLAICVNSAITTGHQDETLRVQHAPPASLIAQNSISSAISTNIDETPKITMDTISKSKSPNSIHQVTASPPLKIKAPCKNRTEEIVVPKERKRIRSKTKKTKTEHVQQNGDSGKSAHSAHSVSKLSEEPKTLPLIHPHVANTQEACCNTNLISVAAPSLASVKISPSTILPPHVSSGNNVQTELRVPNSKLNLLKSTRKKPASTATVVKTFHDDSQASLHREASHQVNHALVPSTLTAPVVPLEPSLLREKRSPDSGILSQEESPHRTTAASDHHQLTSDCEFLPNDKFEQSISRKECKMPFKKREAKQAVLASKIKESTGGHGGKSKKAKSEPRSTASEELVQRNFIKKAAEGQKPMPMLADALNNQVLDQLQTGAAKPPCPSPSNYAANNHLESVFNGLRLPPMPLIVPDPYLSPSIGRTNSAPLVQSSNLVQITEMLLGMSSASTSSANSHAAPTTVHVANSSSSVQKSRAPSQPSFLPISPMLPLPYHLLPQTAKMMTMPPKDSLLILMNQKEDDLELSLLMRSVNDSISNQFRVSETDEFQINISNNIWVTPRQVSQKSDAPDEHLSKESTRRKRDNASSSKSERSRSKASRKNEEVVWKVKSKKRGKKDEAEPSVKRSKKSKAKSDNQVDEKQQSTPIILIRKTTCSQKPPPQAINIAVPEEGASQRKVESVPTTVSQMEVKSVANSVAVSSSSKKKSLEPSTPLNASEQPPQRSRTLKHKKKKRKQRTKHTGHSSRKDKRKSRKKKEQRSPEISAFKSNLDNLSHALCKLKIGPKSGASSDLVRASAKQRSSATVKVPLIFQRLNYLTKIRNKKKILTQRSLSLSLVPVTRVEPTALLRACKRAREESEISARLGSKRMMPATVDDVVNGVAKKMKTTSRKNVPRKLPSQEKPVKEKPAVKREKPASEESCSISFDPDSVRTFQVTKPSEASQGTGVKRKHKHVKKKGYFSSQIPPKDYLQAGLLSETFKTDEGVGNSVNGPVIDKNVGKSVNGFVNDKIVVKLENGLTTDKYDIAGVQNGDSTVLNETIRADYTVASETGNNDNDSELVENKALQLFTTYKNLDSRDRIVDFMLPYDVWLTHGQPDAKASNFSEPKYKRIRTNKFFDVQPVSQVEDLPCRCKPSQDEPGCGSDCLNRAMYVECCPLTCPNGSNCSNQKMQKHEWSPGLERFFTGNRGWGVKSTEPITKGKFILEYIGEVVSEREFKHRMAEDYKNDPHHYCLSLDGGMLIDGYRVANEGRFVNHSCEPNCEMQKWSVNGVYRVGLFAKRDVPPGEELSYDYNFDCFNSETQQQCRCGSENCRGVIGGRKSKSKNNAANGDKKGPFSDMLSGRNKRKSLLRRAASKNITSDNVGLLKIYIKQNPMKKIGLQTSNHIRRTKIFLIRNYEKLRKIEEKRSSVLLNPEIKKEDVKEVKQSLHGLSLDRKGSTRTRTMAKVQENIHLTRTYKLARIFRSIIEEVIGSVPAKCRRESDINRENCGEGEDVLIVSLLNTMPSRKKFPDYYVKIQEPIDFATILKNIASLHYKDVESFHGDLNKLLTNAQEYYDSDEQKLAISALRESFDRKIEDSRAFFDDAARTEMKLMFF